MTEDRSYAELKAWLNDTRDEPLEGMAAFFDARIDTYEEHMARWAEHYRWMAGLLPDGIHTLLDIGCGTGLELDSIFARFPGLCVTGADLSERMLDRLRHKHPDKAMTLLCRDYFRCDLGTDRFDAAVAFETLHHFPAPQKAELFKKIRRALRPGGVYLECDYIAASQEIERLTCAEAARRRERDGIDESEFVHIDTPLTLEHEMNAMESAGFSNVELVGYLPGDGHTAMLRAVK